MEDNSLLRKDTRNPSMRLRFGRRSDVFMVPYEVSTNYLTILILLLLSEVSFHRGTLFTLLTADQKN